MDDEGPLKRRDLGQHFLKEPRIARRIVEAAALRSHDHVLEIGPGDGVLTRQILEHMPGLEVTCVEADPRFAARMRDAGLPGVHIVEGDALRVPFEDFGTVDAVISNLPYQISGPITMRLLELRATQPWHVAVLMFQKEFADRLLATPGSKDQGRLSIYVQRYCEVTKVRDVAPGCFDPPPKVQSTVVKLLPRAEPRVPDVDETQFRLLVDGTFSQRRKKLRNTAPTALSSCLPKEEVLARLDALNLADRRPEELSVEAFGAILGSSHA